MTSYKHAQPIQCHYSLSFLSNVPFSNLNSSGLANPDHLEPRAERKLKITMRTTPPPPPFPLCAQLCIEEQTRVFAVREPPQLVSN